MIGDDFDAQDLLAISPAALSAYARSLGWTKAEEYGSYSNIYSSEELPGILIPRTKDLADYLSIVQRLMATFAKVSETSMLAVYRDLVTADRDAMRLCVSEKDDDGSLPINAGVDLMVGARDMILAAAWSFGNPRPVHRGRPNRKVADYLSRVRLGQTEQGSFTVTVLSPVISPVVNLTRFGEPELHDEPLARQMTQHIWSSLLATRRATGYTSAGDANAFREVVGQGVSANLCEAIAKVLEHFPRLDTTLSWAHTRPVRRVPGIGFAATDGSILREAVRSLQTLESCHDARLVGHVRSLQRGEDQTEGTITVSAEMGGKSQLITTLLPQPEYEIAIKAHTDKVPVVMTGDLERGSQRWRLLNPRIVDVIQDDEDADDNKGHEDGC